VEVCACDPERDAVEFALLEEWQHRPLPILAICRGAQVLNVFHGGTLIPDLGRRNAAHRAPRTKEHDVNIVDGTTLAAIAKSPRALTNSSHHQAVDRLAEGFHLSAVADDGTIEAFESSTDSGSFILGVQWHPELMAPDLPLSQRVLDYFLTQRASTNHGLLSGHE
jgi:putative glutamine amidotransferase